MRPAVAFRCRSASIGAVSSMRLFVVCGDPPPSSRTRSSGVTMTTPQPPGPGLPFAAPSVKTTSARSLLLIIAGGRSALLHRHSADVFHFPQLDAVVAQDRVRHRE